MSNKHPGEEQPPEQIDGGSHSSGAESSSTNQQENALAALALLLGPETEYHVRLRATRRLMRQGPALLPLVLKTLNHYPEITSPAWPWWPPQYEHCSRLLMYLSQSAQIQLEGLLHHPAVSKPVGPILWISVIEAVDVLPGVTNETMLYQGLAAPWETVRYTAAMALARFVDKNPHSIETTNRLLACQEEHEDFPLRLAASYALLRSNQGSGLTTLMQLMETGQPEEIRKAASFIVATEPPEHLTISQRHKLIDLLITMLQDENAEMGLYAARALSFVALPSTLPSLCRLLDSTHDIPRELARSQMQIAILTALEELASRKALHHLIQHDILPGHVVPLLRSPVDEVRRQASYTLAVFGGEYAIGVLGTTLLNADHPGYIEAIEGVRLLHGVLRAPLRPHVLRWLLIVLHESPEDAQAAALDSLSYLAWQAHTHGNKKAKYEISHEIWQDGTVLYLLANQSAWIRQRAIELLGMLEYQLPIFLTRLLQLLHLDSDSGVRACIAYTLGEIAARQAIPDLILALLDSDEHVAETALNSLGKLTTLDDILVYYTLKELTAHGTFKKLDATPLVRTAHRLLKKWQRAVEKSLQSPQEVLHSSP
jgi:HEAT repeat protein